MVITDMGIYIVKIWSESLILKNLAGAYTIPTLYLASPEHGIQMN